MRCVSCKTIEAYAKEAVEAGFAGALKDGRLEWRLVIVEEPDSGHFIQDFQLVTRSVVLELVGGGKPKQWKKLQRIWELGGDEEAFKEYIQDETRAYLEATAK